MKTLRKSVICLFLAIYTANASDYAIDNTRISVYLHPVSLLVGANAKMLMLQSTVETPLSLYNAPIIKPSVWYDKDIFRIGADLGFRHYPGGRGEGLYLQPEVGAFYISAKDLYFDVFDDENDKDYNQMKRQKGAWFDFMGYLGCTYKFRYISIYSDTGIGYNCIRSECSLVFDGNIGIGISF